MIIIVFKNMNYFKNIILTFKVQLNAILTFGFGITGIFNVLINFITHNTIVFIISDVLFLIISTISIFLINKNILISISQILEIIGFSLLLVPIVVILRNINFEFYNSQIIFNIIICLFSSFILFSFKTIKL